MLVLAVYSNNVIKIYINLSGTIYLDTINEVTMFAKNDI